MDHKYLICGNQELGEYVGHDDSVLEILKGTKVLFL